MPQLNTALWLTKPGTTFEVGQAPYTSPGPDEVVGRARAVAVNPIDGLPALAYRIVLPWLTYPAVIGSDVAGEVVEVGADVPRFAVGDRVVGHAASIEKAVNRPAAGAFQHYTVLTQHMVSPTTSRSSRSRSCRWPVRWRSVTRWCRGLSTSTGAIPAWSATVIALGAVVGRGLR